MFTDILLKSNSFAPTTPSYLLILILGKMGKKYYEQCRLSGLFMLSIFKFS